jgi:hypothetical protein
MAQKPKQSSGYFIGARPGREVHHTAIEPPELGRRTVALDRQAFDRIGDREERNLARFRLEYGDAVEEVFVRTRSSAVDARQR